MELIKIAIQIIIAVSIFNVWVLRFRKPTRWRGGTAKSMKEEFETYGLPLWFMNLIGFLKLSLATLLIVGIFLPDLVKLAAIGMACLMLGAVVMHIKVKDPVMKLFPAFTFLVLSLTLIFV
ncbi:MAG: DoxX family protein [Candidatus Paceibacterota bacterium]